MNGIANTPLSSMETASRKEIIINSRERKRTRIILMQFVTGSVL